MESTSLTPDLTKLSLVPLSETSQLTPDQQEILTKILEFIRSPNETAKTLVGCAGTGKSFLTRQIVNSIRNTLRVCGVAPTHKARKVLERYINDKTETRPRFIEIGEATLKIKTMTVASLLNKIRSHSYIGTKKFVRGGDNKMEQFDVFLVDECSMITDDDIDTIIYYAKQLNKKVLFIGDKYQIPAIGQGYKNNKNGTIQKKDSKVFELPTFELTKIIRQGITHPLLEIYPLLRKNINIEYSPDRTSNLITIEKLELPSVAFDKIRNVYTTTDKEFNTLAELNEYYKIQTEIGVRYYTESTKASMTPFEEKTEGDSLSKFEKKIKKEFTKDPINKRVLVYTNESVRYYNTLIRKMLGYAKGRTTQASADADSPETLRVSSNLASPDTSRFVVGEMLIGYTNLGFPDLILENGQEYFITKIEPTKSYTIKETKEYTNLTGEIVTLEEAICNDGVFNKTGIFSRFFFPDISSESNYEILSELTKRAEKVNRQFSTKEDYKKYCKLRDKLLFTEDVYKFNDSIMTESEFRKVHPLLFKSVREVISEDSEGERKITKNKLSEDLNTKYPDLLETRLQDDKSLIETELLCDKYKILDKNLDYAYASTIHKIQGSTLLDVFLDESDLDKLKDCWNYRMDAMETRTREKNQLRYVAYTRPKNRLFVYYRE